MTITQGRTETAMGLEEAYKSEEDEDDKAGRGGGGKGKKG